MALRLNKENYRQNRRWGKAGDSEQARPCARKTVHRAGGSAVSNREQSLKV